MAIKLIAEGRVRIEGRKVIIDGVKKERWAVTNPPLEI
jgi:hypothetical protein